MWRSIKGICDFASYQTPSNLRIHNNGERFKGDLVRSEDEIAEGSLLSDVDPSCDLFHLGLRCCNVPLHIVRKLAVEIIVFETDFCFR